MPSYAVAGRVEAREITRIARLSRDSEIRPRVAILAFAVIVDVEAVQFFKNDVILIVAVTFFGAMFFVARINFTRMRWAFGEVFGGYPLSYRVSHERENEKPADEQPVKSRSIRIRNLMCTLEEHSEIVEIAAKQPEQWPDLDLSRWYRPVLVAHIERDAVKLGILGREKPVWIDPDACRYFRRVRPWSSVPRSWSDESRSVDVAKTLTDLLDFLSEEEEREDVVVERLISQYGDSDWSVRNAFLVAQSAKLIARDPKIPAVVGVFLVVVQAFMPFKLRAGFGGHSTCKIKLTELGAFWREADVNSSDTEIDLGRSDQGSVVMNIQSYGGDHYEVRGSANSVGRGNIVSGNQINQGPPWAENLDFPMLVEELKELSEYLIAQAKDRTQFLAIKQVEDAIDAAEKRDKEASLEHLSKLGKLSGWVMDAGKAIGVGVAVAAINVALGNSH